LRQRNPIIARELERAVNESIEQDNRIRELVNLNRLSEYIFHSLASTLLPADPQRIQARVEELLQPMLPAYCRVTTRFDEEAQTIHAYIEGGTYRHGTSFDLRELLRGQENSNKFTEWSKEPIPRPEYPTRFERILQDDL
jgi:hypothetical protein